MSTSNSKRRAEIGRERREKTHRRLIAAAARVIVDRGEERATIDDFIQAAGVARGTFYNYFSTREEIIEALWASIGKDPFRQIAAACRTIDNAAEQLITFARLVIDRTARDQVWGWLIYAMSSDPKTVNDDLRSFPSPELEAGAAEGTLSFEQLESESDLVVCVVRNAMRVNLTGPVPDGYNESTCRMILLALGVGRREADRLIRLPLPRIKGTKHDIGAQPGSS